MMVPNLGFLLDRDADVASLLSVFELTPPRTGKGVGDHVIAASGAAVVFRITVGKIAWQRYS